MGFHGINFSIVAVNLNMTALMAIEARWLNDIDQMMKYSVKFSVLNICDD